MSLLLSELSLALSSIFSLSLSPNEKSDNISSFSSKATISSSLRCCDTKKSLLQHKYRVKVPSRDKIIKIKSGFDYSCHLLSLFYTPRARERAIHSNMILAHIFGIRSGRVKICSFNQCLF
ncbi:hypothetical protein C0J52_02981 [Blattella germanica]|nr:hypothetical protein C0J52_02981 [Blattella germanica]